jgi:hypothetical protein
MTIIFLSEYKIHCCNKRGEGGAFYSANYKIEILFKILYINTLESEKYSYKNKQESQEKVIKQKKIT